MRKKYFKFILPGLEMPDYGYSPPTGEPRRIWWLRKKHRLDWILWQKNLNDHREWMQERYTYIVILVCVFYNQCYRIDNYALVSEGLFFYFWNFLLTKQFFLFIFKFTSLDDLQTNFSVFFKNFYNMYYKNIWLYNLIGLVSNYCGDINLTVNYFCKLELRKKFLNFYFFKKNFFSYMVKKHFLTHVHVHSAFILKLDLFLFFF